MAITKINSTAVHNAFAGSSLAASATSLTAGNLIVVATTSLTASSFVTSITDTAGNTYSHLIGRGISARWLDLWYANNCLGHASNVVTVTYSTSVNARGIATVQYSGAASSSVVDVSNSGSTNSAVTTVVLGAITTTVTNEVIVAAGVNNATGGTWVPYTGFTTVVDDASGTIHLEDKIVASIQTALAVTLTCSAAAKMGVICSFAQTPVGASSGLSPFVAGNP